MMGKPLDKISISGFKSIKELNNFKLGPLNILIGSNGAGKSNFISFFKLLNELVEGRLQKYIQKSGGSNTLLYHGNKTTNEISLELTFGLNSYKCKLSPSDDDSMFIQDEVCLFHPGSFACPYDVPVQNSGKESGLDATSKREKVAKYVLNSMQSWKVYHFHDTSDTAEIKPSCYISDNEVFRHDAANLPAYLYLLSKNYVKEYSNIINTIRMVAPFFADFNLRANPLSPEKIQLEWKHEGSDA